MIIICIILSLSVASIIFKDMTFLIRYVPGYLLLVLYFTIFMMYFLCAWEAVAPCIFFIFFTSLYANQLIIIDEVIKTIKGKEDITHVCNDLVMEKLKHSIRRYSTIKKCRFIFNCQFIIIMYYF